VAISSKGPSGAEVLELSDGQSAGVSGPDSICLRANAATSQAEVSAFGGTYSTIGTLFGQDYAGAADRSRTTTTSATFQTKVTLVTPVLTGSYVVRWAALVEQSSTTSQVEVRLQNTTMGYSMGAWQLMQPHAAVNRMIMGGSIGFGLVAASNTFEIQYRALGGNTAAIQDAVIDFWRTG
jgi:hypothetical protein